MKTKAVAVRTAKAEVVRTFKKTAPTAWAVVFNEWTEAHGNTSADISNAQAKRVSNMKGMLKLMQDQQKYTKRENKKLTAFFNK